MDDMSRLSYLSRAIHVVADLRVADVTGQELLSAADIAERAGMHAVSLERVLRFPSAYGVFSEVAQGEFRNTSLSESLR